MGEELIVVAGGGGFIGSHLVARLLEEGRGKVRAVDCKPTEEWFQTFSDVDNRILDLKRADACEEALAGATEVYNLAADMGGMGFIEAN
jgi:nucleoside-diphosphate-sugar epimerase